MTGIWQAECRSRIPLSRPEATALDLRYAATMSPATDLGILARTIVAVISARGSY
jgi:lipopolysaccharide/colanic/teichoic acid biosynthesis glycosyltransferase